MVDTINETDQWKLNGDCTKCRRKEFCRKSCTAKTKAEERRLSAFKNVLLDAMLPGIPRRF